MTKKSKYTPRPRFVGHPSLMASLVLTEDTDTRMIVDAGTSKEREVATFRLQLHCGSVFTSIASTKARDASEATDVFAGRLRDLLKP